MKNKKDIRYLVLFIVGIVLLGIGGLAIRGTSSKLGAGVLIVLGAGLFGMSVGELIRLWLIDKAPKYQQKIAIEKNDERNIIINNKAKVKAFDLMLTVHSTLILIVALLKTDLLLTLLLAGAYLLILAVYVACLVKYQKEM